MWFPLVCSLFGSKPKTESNQTKWDNSVHFIWFLVWPGFENSWNLIFGFDLILTHSLTEPNWNMNSHIIYTFYLNYLLQFYIYDQISITYQCIFKNFMFMIKVFVCNFHNDSILTVNDKLI